MTVLNQSGNEVIDVQKEFAYYAIQSYKHRAVGREGNYPVEVKPAGNKGMGVFATKNIQKNQVCCFYDGFFDTGPMCGVVITGQHGYGQSAPFNGNPNYLLAGFPTQLRPGGCAQMCNDASTTYTNRNRKYLEHINVKETIDEDGCVLFVATKRIKKGTELLYSYGPGYWSSNRSRTKRQNNVMGLWKELVHEHKLDFDLSLKQNQIYLDLLSTYKTEGMSLSDFQLRYILVSIFRDLQK